MQPSSVVGHTAIIDPPRSRMLVFGGGSGDEALDGVWELSLGANPQWQQVPTQGALPPGSSYRSAIYDPLRDRMVVFSGSGASDVWVLTLGNSPTWSQLVTTGGPPPNRNRHSAIYDAVRDRMIVFGGTGATTMDDVWELSFATGAAWSQLAPSGSLPAARRNHGAIYDPIRDRMLVFAGEDIGGVEMNDLWSLDFNGSLAWTELSPAGVIPGPRERCVIQYDPAQDRVLAFGGKAGAGILNELWELSLSGIPTWNLLSPTGEAPEPRYAHVAVIDLAGDRLLVFGGYGEPTYMNDAWQLSLSGGLAWSKIAPGLAPALLTTTDLPACYDDFRGEMVVFVGTGGPTSMWSLALSSGPIWSKFAATGTPPSSRGGASVVYDSAADRAIVFGGLESSGYLNDIWTLSLGDDPEWIEIFASGTPPSARTEHAAVYDPARNRVVVVGGYDGGAYRRDVWELSLDGTPTWTLLEPTGVKPLARMSHTAIYDASRDRVVVFGGTKPPVSYDDAWALDLAGAGAWSEILPAGPRPERTVDHCAVYDPSRDRMVAFGGSGQTIQNETTALSFAGTPTWSVLATGGTTPDVRFRAASAYDPASDRMIVFGGDTVPGTVNDLWALDWGTATGIPMDGPFAPAAASVLKHPRPNPFSSSARFDFSLAATGRARLEVFDVSGRRRRLVLDSTLPPGEHSAVWNGADDVGRPVASGAYFLRLSTPSRVAVQKVTRIHDALR